MLKDAMLDLQDELFTESQIRMQTPEGKADLTKEQVSEVAHIITVSIVGGAWAVMDEYGTGSKMDTDNPALDDYRKSKMWNPARPDLTIRSRPDTPGQIDIFGKPVVGKGTGGIDLEALGIVEPTVPSKAMQTAMNAMKNDRFREKIRDTIKHFPFHSFFVIDEK